MPSFVTQTHEYNRALLDAIAQAMGPTLDLRDLPPSETAWTLLESEADMALASPLLYGQREGDMAILGGACVAAVGATGEWLLHFHEGLQSIETVGFYGERGLHTIVAEIVLKEKYGMKPRLLQVHGPAEEAMSLVDALLTTEGEQRSGFTSSSHIDVIDEWFDMTQLPLVREIVIGWEARMDAAIDAAVRQAGDAIDTEALHVLDMKMQGRNAATETETLPGHFRYRFTEEAVEGLQVFFQMAFFHGLHRDIPDFAFWVEGEEGAEGVEGAEGTEVS
ncbi:MAG: hypothetical protein IH600_08415 [Bacteroidetes bacterium]|nr:hypothetical protein [Bacteroidota bacterium]